MPKIKILNLYAGIGGNRKLWQDVDVTAIELNPQIAKIYQDFFPLEWFMDTLLAIQGSTDDIEIIEKEQTKLLDQAETLIKSQQPKGKGHKCPWCKATTCYLDYECNGCETYAENIQQPKRMSVEEIIKIIEDSIIYKMARMSSRQPIRNTKELAQSIFSAGEEK